MKYESIGRPYGLASCVFFSVLTLLNIYDIVIMMIYGTGGTVALASAFVRIAAYVTICVFVLMGRRNLFVALAQFACTAILAASTFYVVMVSPNFNSLKFLAAIFVDLLLVLSNLFFALVALNEAKPRISRSVRTKTMAVVATVLLSVYSALYLLMFVFTGGFSTVFAALVAIGSTLCLFFAYLFLRFWLTATENYFTNIGR